MNISEQGAFCATPAPMDAGATVQVRFRHPWTDEAVTAAAVVMRRSRTGDGLGPQGGVALALLDSLSDLEDGEANVSLSDSLVPGAISTLRQLQDRAVQAEAKRSGSNPTVTSGPNPTISGSHVLPTITGSSRRPAAVAGGSKGLGDATCTWEGTGFDKTAADVQKLSAHGFVVLTGTPPAKGRLVRIEVDGTAATVHPIRIAGKVTWSSATDEDAKADGFGVHILHFLSSADERRYQDLLLSTRTA